MMPTAFQHFALAVFGLLLYVGSTYATNQRRHPSVAAAWVISLAGFPYLSIPAFLLFGVRKFRTPAKLAPLPETVVPDAPAWAVRMLCGLGISAPVINQSVRFHANGQQAYDDLIDTIASAAQTLEVGTYVLADDESGRAIIDALLAARARNVQVRLLIDAVGSWRLSHGFLQRIRAGGIEVHRFMPFFHNPARGKNNLRNHRKLVIADGHRLWSGGRNLADEYFVTRENQPAWIDMSFSIVGPVARQAIAQFERDWALTRWRALKPAEKPTQGGGSGTTAAPVHVEAVSHAQPVAQWIPSGPDRDEDTLHGMLLAAVYRAGESITAITPYFVPDDALLNAMCLASRAGVDVRLMVPAKSNHWITDLARERALRELAGAGATILLAPQMTHAKLVIVDQQLALSGSANLDGRSLFLNYEVMTAFYSAPEIRWLQDWADQHMEDAPEYEASQPAWWVDLAEGVARSVGVQL